MIDAMEKRIIIAKASGYADAVKELNVLLLEEKDPSKVIMIMKDKAMKVIDKALEVTK